MDYVGIDLHKKESHICILSEGGQLSECRIAPSFGGSPRYWAAGGGRGSCSRHRPPVLP